VLLLDEPASGLDPLGRIELRKLMLQLRDIGKTVLISSHILTELSGFCNKAAIMERGRLVMAGTIAELGQKLGRRQLFLKWRNADDLGLQILKREGVKNLEANARGASFEFEGNTDALDGLLKTLVVEGVRVTEWRDNTDDLEQIFLQSGARELM
jgi:ABC-2 type transport system ATP-binding protein